MTEPGFSIVCVSRQDWHAGLPTNRQQIMIRAAQRGHRVLFVESGGHIGRHLAARHGPDRGSVARRLFGGEQPAESITVAKALTFVPWGQKFPLANRINSRFTGARIRRAARGLGGPRILWIYDPTAFELVGQAGEDLTVYDVVDDYAEQVGPDARRRRFVAAADEAAACRSQVVFATTTGLYERQLSAEPGDAPRSQRRRLRAFLAHERDGARGALLRRAGRRLRRQLDRGEGRLRPARGRRPGAPRVEPRPRRASGAKNARGQLDRARSSRQRACARLQALRGASSLRRGFSVGVIPYRATAYTRNCSPLKVYEYLAAGKAVVASGVPELRGWSRT